MDTREPEPGTDARKPYIAPELKEFGTIADLTMVSVPTGPKNDAATMGFDKSAG